MTKFINVKLKAWRFLLAMTILGSCSGYKILVVFPHPNRSHAILGDALVRILLKAGHQVTYITPFVPKTPEQNLSYIDVYNTTQVFGGNQGNYFDLEMLINKQKHLDHNIRRRVMRHIAELLFTDSNIKAFLEDSDQKFDLVIAEWLFIELFSVFAAFFNCPYIWMYPYVADFIATSLMDTQTNPAYTSNMELGIVPPFTFLERVRNLWFQVSYQLEYYYFHHGLEREIYDRLFAPILLKRHGTVVPYELLRYNASLMLSYFHYSEGRSPSIPQNLIPVGGYHVEDSPPPLPEDIKNIMDNATEGVIYFSMGSNLQSQSFPKDMLKDLLKMFSETKYTVIWKFEGNLQGHPDNVHILNWAPQQSILAHPKCVLFITHGGLLSKIEAVHYGIPIIGIPVFCDQFSNVERAVSSGFAKKVMLSNNLVKDLRAAIMDILSDDRYAAKAKELSFLYHQRPISPAAEVVYWVQHVIATTGAPDLRSPALLLSWYQKFYLDLLALIMLLLVCTGWTLHQSINRRRHYQVDFPRKKVA